MADTPTLLSANNYHYPRGGAETVFLDHNALFQAHGWRVVPFCMKHPNNTKTGWERFFVDEIEFGTEYSIAQKLIKGPKTIYSLEARRKIAQLIEEVQPDVFHGHNIYHHISPSILGRVRELNIPTVLTLHDLKIACPAYKMYNSRGVCERCKSGNILNVVKHRCVKESLVLSSLVFVEALTHRILRTYERHVDAFIVPSQFFRRKLIEWGVEESKLHYVPNFLDLDGYASSPTTSDHFVYFGRLSDEKGLRTLVQAAAKANVSVKLVGTGPIEQELRLLASQTKAPVSFTGYLSGPALRDEIASARAVVLPSEWYENAPLSVLEAYALGRPVLGADIGGIPELIEPGRTGLLFASANSDDLAEKLTQLHELTADDINQMGVRARCLVSEAHNPSRYVEKVKGVYEAAKIGTARV